jgi:RimJ/RimL family protein N-acetyltransferase
VTVILREVLESDLEAHYEQQADPESIAMAAVPARNREDHDAHWRQVLADDACLVRTIDVDGDVAGHVCSFLRDGREPREVGYWIARSHWGHGVASAALAAFLEDDEPRRPLIAGVAVHNPGSRRVLEKCGFTLTETATDPEGDGVDEWRFRLD